MYALSMPLFMLSNIADTVNKHTMTMAGDSQKIWKLSRIRNKNIGTYMFGHWN